MTPNKIPYAWPMDGRSKSKPYKNTVILVHPERSPVMWNAAAGKWEEINDKP